MKAADVRILPALDPGESYVDPSFLLVETANDAAGEAVTTIHHVASATGDGDGWKVATLGHSGRKSIFSWKNGCLSYAIWLWQILRGTKAICLMLLN